MLYLIGLGLNEKSISLDGIESIKKCRKIYLEIYTTNLPYSIKKLEKTIGKKVVKLNREDVESDRLVKEAKKENICLLIYGSPFFATTHISLIEECKNKNVKFRIIYNASIFDAIGETGSQLYKFGKICSMPRWQENFEPDSFIEIIKENKKNNVHSLILIDPDLKFKTALEQLVIASDNKKLKLDKIIICNQLGTKNSEIYYIDIKSELKREVKKIKTPFCFIIPGKLHFFEKQVIERFS
mgnify:CR=1 FL=1